MPKGKKFDAAEKHFLKKEAGYQEQIKRLRAELKQSKDNYTQAISDKLELERENHSLQQWVDRLLEYTELSKDDIKKVCEQDKRHGEAVIALRKMYQMFGGYM